MKWILTIMGDFDRDSKSEDCKTSFTLLEDDVSFEAVGESFTTRQSETDIKILNQIKVFGMFQFLKRNEQQLLSLLIYADPSVNDLRF